MRMRRHSSLPLLLVLLVVDLQLALTRDVSDSTQRVKPWKSPGYRGSYGSRFSPNRGPNAWRSTRHWLSNDPTRFALKSPAQATDNSTTPSGDVSTPTPTTTPDPSFTFPPLSPRLDYRLPESALNLVNANNKFAFKLSNELVKEREGKGNIFFSPLSLFSTLLPVYSGSSSETANELLKVLEIKSLNETQIEEGFRDVLHSLLFDVGKENTLKILNALLVDKEANISRQYTDRVRTYYNSYLEKVGFASEPEYVQQWANQLVSWWTEGHIKTLLSSPVDPLTKMLLLNAIYFKGKWSETFDPRFTSDHLFRDATGESKMVPMMKMTSKYQVFCDNTTYQTCAVELFYSGGSLSFLILIPASGTDLSKLDKALSPMMMYHMIANLEERSLEFGLPKFALESDLNMRAPLMSLGMKSAFSAGKANFSRIGSVRDFCVKDVKHKSLMSVSEEGTLASGATFVTIGNRIGSPRFYIDRPFIFLIRDLKTDAIIFMGRVTSLP